VVSYDTNLRPADCGPLDPRAGVATPRRALADIARRPAID
jgi:hypothetical protein